MRDRLYICDCVRDRLYICDCVWGGSGLVRSDISEWCGVIFDSWLVVSLTSEESCVWLVRSDLSEWGVRSDVSGEEWCIWWGVMYLVSTDVSDWWGVTYLTESTRLNDSAAKALRNVLSGYFCVNSRHKSQTVWCPSELFLATPGANSWQSRAQLIPACHGTFYVQYFYKWPVTYDGKGAELFHF